MVWISGAIAAGGAVAGSLISSGGQSNANSRNIKLARENRDWQEMMSNTAHQRETKDLEAAGLNRILGMGGGGSSTPSGNVATVQNENAAFAEGTASAVSSALAAKRLKQELKNMAAIEKKDKAAKFLVDQQERESVGRHHKLNAETELLTMQKAEAGAMEQMWIQLGKGGSSAKGMTALLPFLKLLTGR